MPTLDNQQANHTSSTELVGDEPEPIPNLPHMPTLDSQQARTETSSWQEGKLGIFHVNFQSFTVGIKHCRAIFTNPTNTTSNP
jgi:hypothetical protein